MLLNKNYNKNESKIHYELKQIAKYVLYQKGYTCIATEVSMTRYNRYLDSYPWFNKNAVSKIIIDAVGIRGNLINTRHMDLENYKSMGIESKASYSDFINGFCTQCEYTYVIAPVGIIPIDKIPDKIGLIEVDLDNYRIEWGRDGFVFEGIYFTKRCASRKKELWQRKDIFTADMHNLMRRIAYRSTVNDVFNNNEIVVKGCKRSEKET